MFARAAGSASASRSSAALALVVLVGWSGTRASAQEGQTSDPKQRAEVHGVQMAYVEAGQGDPIVFLHGNPTSSYLWRNVIPHLEPLGRCIAPDLIGMGDSAKLEPRGEGGRDGRYRYVEHRRYLDALLAELGVEREVTFVVHDWGATLGFDWARRHPERVRAIAYMEAVVRPGSWEETAFVPWLVFRSMRGFAGELLVLRWNLFVEQLLPRLVIRELSEAEMAAYRAPYLEPGESRRPTLTWPRELPFDGEPEDTYEIVKANADWLRTSDVPKLLVRGEPGALISGATLDFVRQFSNQTEIAVPGLHYLQEDSPDEIGSGIARWLTDLRQHAR